MLERIRCECFVGCLSWDDLFSPFATSLALLSCARWPHACMNVTLLAAQHRDERARPRRREHRAHFPSELASIRARTRGPRFQAGLQSPKRVVQIENEMLSNRSEPKGLRYNKLGPARVLGPEDRSNIESKTSNHVEIESIEPRPTLVSRSACGVRQGMPC